MPFLVKMTPAGLAAFAAAYANSTPVNLLEVAIGDGNGAPITPTGNETQLYHELNRHPIESHSIHEDNDNWIVVNFVIPAESGGYTIRELGIYNHNNVLLAIASYPATYKPLLSEGFSSDLEIDAIMMVTNASEITIIDGGSVVYATRVYVTNFVNEYVNWYNLNW